VPRLPRWRKQRPNAPLEVIGTDGVLDLHAGDADVSVRGVILGREKGSHLDAI
jgi:LysR family glycine cleavage system transcriptional activator